MFVEGDVVVLKSGGPNMTVIEVTDDQHVITTWFEGDNARQGGFPCAAVKKYDPGPAVLVPKFGTIA